MGCHYFHTHQKRGKLYGHLGKPQSIRQGSTPNSEGFWQGSNDSPWEKKHILPLQAITWEVIKAEQGIHIAAWKYNGRENHPLSGNVIPYFQGKRLVYAFRGSLLSPRVHTIRRWRVSICLRFLERVAGKGFQRHLPLATRQLVWGPLAQEICEGARMTLK